MRVIIISQPKAGTYLCANLLETLGLTFARMHVRENNYTAVHKKIEYQRKNLRKQKIRCNLDKTVLQVEDSEFIVGHVEYNDYTKNCLQGFKKILLLRDLASCKKSWKSWAKVVNKSTDTLLLDPDFRNNIAAWGKNKDVFEMSFYDLKKCNVAMIDKLQLFLFDDISIDSSYAIKNALQKDSLTKVIE